MISVIIPIFNPCKDFLYETVNSIKNQIYTNYEVLLIVDGDASITEGVVYNLKDSRFRILINTEGKGLPYSLNRGFMESKGDYIFRMDADDICMPERFGRQVEFLETHPDVDMVGSFAQTFGAVSKVYKSYTSYKDINAELLFKNPIVHPTVAFRKKTIEMYGLKYTNGEAEDYRLWLDMVLRCHCRIEVIPEVLLKYRIHEDQSTVVKKSIIQNMDQKITKEIIEKLGIRLSSKGYKEFSRLRNTSDKIKVHDVIKIFKMRNELKNKLPDNISKITFDKLFGKIILKKLISNHY